jgi:hydroxymethylglutaryl-CoA synthase
MKPGRGVGVAGYGIVIPRFRVSTKDIAEVWRPNRTFVPPVMEKSVPARDEDSVTLAIDAARTAVRCSRQSIEKLGAIWVGTESKPYAAKPCASLVASAIGAPNAIMASDFEFACKGGSEAMQAATAAVGSGMVSLAMAIGVDVAQARPGDILEYMAASGAAAFLLAPAEDSIATIDGSFSYVSNTPDFFRRARAMYPQHGGRFTEEPGYFRHSIAASRALMDEMGVTAKDFAHAVFHQPLPKLVERAAKDLGFTKTQLERGFCAPRFGNAYAASSMIALAAVLDTAQPGERVFFCSYGSGAGSDAFAFTVTQQIAERRSAAPVSSFLNRRKLISGYGQYLRVMGSIRM